MYKIVTIERRYASGGNEIGKKLAKALGYKLYDRNILIKAAENLEIPYFQIEGLEESTSGGILMNLSQTALGGLSGNRELPLADKLFLEEKRIIEEAAEAGNCVIVGRAAGYILRERKDALRVFVYADKEKRIRRAIEREGIDQAEAENALKKNDKRRGGFYTSVTSWKWGAAEYYDLHLNAGTLGIDPCVKILEEAVRGTDSVTP